MLPEWRLLVLAAGETPAAISSARGHLFEVFIAKLLHGYGYSEPSVRHVNVTSEGIELDVVTSSRLGNSAAIAECKAYSRPVKAAELTNFLGKLTVERYTNPDILGLMVVVPKLTAQGEEKARAISVHDKRFLYLPAEEIVERLRKEGHVTDTPVQVVHSSDPAIVITQDGIFSACMELHPDTRAPARVIMWAAKGAVPEPTLALLRQDEFAQDLAVIDAGASEMKVLQEIPHELHVLATVQASREDFQYQLPAAPKFFVGRRAVLSSLSELLDRKERIYVFNAQSGWGKSSLALKFAEMVSSRRGLAFVMDTRTASNSRYLVEVLRNTAEKAQGYGLLKLPDDPSWATLSSSLRTYQRARWLSADQEILIFFDQFENVFRSEDLTRSFRDLALGARESGLPLIIGFAWKTDLVGWTEGHPYQLRDEIRSNSAVVVVEPFGSKEVTTLLDRLEKRTGVKLVPDLRNRLREYSQGLPWLLKKLADHVVRELERGVTQEQLLAEALNVQSLFNSDLAELDPTQLEVLNHVARYAPIPASEITARFAPEAVQSLVDRRLLVQVGDRLDTYWDTFRDYLNTGSVPVEDSYILRQTPGAVARMLPAVMSAGGSASVRDLAESLGTSDNVIFNLSRELRLMGVTGYEPLRVKITEEILQASDPEVATRLQIARSLRRHKALSLLKAADERSAGLGVGVELFAEALPRAFPAVAVKNSTWLTYARSFINWFEYAGLIVSRGGTWHVAPDSGVAPGRRLLSARPVIRARPSVPQESWGPSREVLRLLGISGAFSLSHATPRTRDAVRTLVALRAVTVDVDYVVRLASEDLVRADGEAVPSRLLALLEAAPGGAAGLTLLQESPDASPAQVGEAIRASIGASWTKASAHGVGGYFRAWSKVAGVVVASVPRMGKPRGKVTGPTAE